jgi:hypothetical protein
VDSRSTDQIVADVCAALDVERVEIRPPTRYVEYDEPQQQIVRTAPFAYFGNDRLDVSPGSADPIGAWFAPSREIASVVETAFKCSHYLGTNTLIEFGKAYTAEMRARYGVVPDSEAWDSLSDADQRRVYRALSRGVEPVPAAWDALRAMREVTLVCTCADATRCHRALLARILEKLGAKYVGELT